MSFKMFTFICISALCFTAFARPTTNTELGDVVNIHPDTPLTPITPTATLEEFAAAVKDAMRKAELHPSPKIPLDTDETVNDNTVTDNNDNNNDEIVGNRRVATVAPNFDSKHFNDIMLNAVLDAVRKQVSNPDGSFDFMTIIKQLFDIWAKRFDHNKDGEVTIAEFAQWLIQFVKEKLEKLSN